MLLRPNYDTYELFTSYLRKIQSVDTRMIFFDMSKKLHFLPRITASECECLRVLTSCLRISASYLRMLAIDYELVIRKDS